MLVGIRSTVAGLNSQGRSIQEIVAASPSAGYDAKWGSYLVPPELFTRLVYKGV